MGKKTHNVFITFKAEVQVEVTGCCCAEEALRVAKGSMELHDMCSGVEVEFDTDEGVEAGVVGAHGWFEDMEGDAYAE